jgi:hypothetical protein
VPRLYERRRTSGPRGDCGAHTLTHSPQIDGRLILMELEINEPFLFIGASPNAAHRFVEAIDRVMRLALRTFL